MRRTALAVIAGLCTGVAQAGSPGDPEPKGPERQWTLESGTAADFRDQSRQCLEAWDTVHGDFGNVVVMDMTRAGHRFQMYCPRGFEGLRVVYRAESRGDPRLRVARAWIHREARGGRTATVSWHDRAGGKAREVVERFEKDLADFLLKARAKETP